MAELIRCDECTKELARYGTLGYLQITIENRRAVYGGEDPNIVKQFCGWVCIAMYADKTSQSNPNKLSD